MAKDTKAMLAAMMAGKMTKETEMMKHLVTGDIDSKVAAKIMRESDLPSASDLNFTMVAGSNGQRQMMEANDALLARSSSSIDKDAILALMGGKKPREINEERQRKMEAEAVSVRPSAKPSLSESILQSDKTFDEDRFNELVENKVYDILGSIVGEVNNKLKNKDIIKEKLTESIMFLKLTKKLQEGK